MNQRIARLRWRCRRGMRELDAVLLGFVDAAGAQLSDPEIGCFERILELPDPLLHAYLLGRSAPDDSATGALIARIRSNVSPAA